SVGQNLKTSTYIGEIIFAIFIAVFGLVLFALLIGNMQVILSKEGHSDDFRDKGENRQTD
ncbi:cyclic nucleotide-gated ion channel 15, partial [Trifolium medium]|nr:cyclic nucleotide-gated ion channel 15 [Trifolium medium]